MVDAARMRSHPPAAPGPYRRADEMHRADAALFNRAFEAEIEIRRVDADEKLGPLAEQPCPELAPDADSSRYRRSTST